MDIILESFNKFFDKDTRPVEATRSTGPEPVQKLARRRRYSHTFSAGRKRKLIRDAKGRNKWRIVPDGALVHYGKQFSHRKKKDPNLGKRNTGDMDKND